MNNGKFIFFSATISRNSSAGRAVAAKAKGKRERVGEFVSGVTSKVFWIMNVNFFTFNRDNFVCSKCGWQGKGCELSNGDFSEEHSICDLDCPSCGGHIGFWQAPLKDEVEKWRMENPGVKSGWNDLDD